ncbi:MAG: hypothetical protein WC822_06395 [Candidatus Paceibacterota bacterium]|jgi:hypothetical protein
MEATRVQTGEKVKIPKKVLSAKALYEQQMKSIRSYNVLTKIADSALPKHKRARWDEIVARGWVKATQAESKFSQAFKKLAEGERRLLIDIQRGAINVNS